MAMKFNQPGFVRKVNRLQHEIVKRFDDNFKGDSTEEWALSVAQTAISNLHSKRSGHELPISDEFVLRDLLLAVMILSETHDRELGTEALSTLDFYTYITTGKVHSQL